MSPFDATRRDQECMWVRRAQRGDPEAFGRLVDVYDRRLLYFVRRFLPDSDQALDVLQEVWLALFRRLPDLRAPEAFRVWLYQIAHNQVVTLLRRQQREVDLQEALWNGRNGEMEEDSAPTADQAELVHHALGLLSPEHREVLTLRFLEDLRLEEIAEVVGCSLGTVKSRLHYARQALRREVEKLLHE